MTPELMAASADAAALCVSVNTQASRVSGSSDGNSAIIIPKPTTGTNTSCTAATWSVVTRTNQARGQITLAQFFELHLVWCASIARRGEHELSSERVKLLLYSNLTDPLLSGSLPSVSSGTSSRYRNHDQRALDRRPRMVQFRPVGGHPVGTGHPNPIKEVTS